MGAKCNLIFILTFAMAFATPLDDYVAKEDGCFNYLDTGVTRGGNGWTGYIWNVTSQCWLDPTLANRNIWWHFLIVVVPHDVNTSSRGALLYITGGGNSNPTGFPGNNDEDLLVSAQIALSSRSVAAVLYQVPNQPLTFPWDPWHHPNREEDGAIAVTWWHYIQNTSFPDIILELPMTKAGVRALDALQLIAPKYTGTTPTDLFVSGASKRGWTTWLVGAVEAAAKNRVKGIIPIVLDAINFVAFAHRQWQFYGAWSFALQDYYKANITQYFDSPQVAQLQTIIDPYFYRKRLTMPKLAINAGGDEFQMPDDHRYWAHDMVGEMNLALVKNAEHAMITGILEALQSAGSFVQSLVKGASRPAYTWDIDSNGVITVTTNRVPKVVTLAVSASAEGVSHGRRDFRWAALNVSFCPVKIFGACVRPLLWNTTTSGVVKVDNFTYRGIAPVPTEGWVVFMLEMQWDNPSGPDDFYFTSPASVLPNTFPFPDCHGTNCRGTLC
jgi:PhoPQ-activated pathogenicity-related protein